MWIPPDEQQTILPYDGTTKNIHVQPWNFKPRTCPPKVRCRPFPFPFRRSLLPRPPASLLSVTPKSSILAPHVLNAMKMALITGKAVAPPQRQHQDDTRKRKPVDDDAVAATNSINTNKKFISTREVMRAEAAYGIARELVSWMDHIIVDEDGNAPSDEKLESDIDPTPFSTLANDIKIEDVKLEDLSSSVSPFLPMYIRTDEKLEDDDDEEIKTSSVGGWDHKHDADEKKLDDCNWYRSGHVFQMPSLSSFKDSWRAQPSQQQSQHQEEMITSPAIETPNSEINTPNTQLSLSSQASSDDSYSSESQQQSQTKATAATGNQFGNPIAFDHHDHDQHDSTAASSPLPLPLSLPLLPTLSELNMCIPFPTGSPIIGNFHEKTDIGNGTSTLFPDTIEGWQALATN